MKKLFLVLVLWQFPLFADPAIDGVLAPGGVWWKPKSRLTITKAITLQQDTQWSADEIRIKAPITTNGKLLLLVARRLVFDDGAMIRGFASLPGSIEGEGPPHQTPANVGASRGAAGSNGAKGKTGITGNPGMGSEGALPKEILIFAAHVEGKVVIDGTGQTGGMGGKGGKGQDGGDGAQGTNAICRAFADNTAAGNGGQGGDAGPGGKGGKGGTGGAPVPFQFITVSDYQSGQKLPQLACAPGTGGPGGTAGGPGKPGTGGPGGLSSSVTFFLNWETEPGGSTGASGKAADNSAAYQAANTGDVGSAGVMPTKEQWTRHVGRERPDVIDTFQVWEAKRFEAALAWFEFHWWRLYERVARSSVIMMLPEELEAAKPAEQDPLEQLIPGGFDREAVEVVAAKWSKVFLEPLQAELKNTQGRNERLTRQLENIVSAADLFTQAVKNAEERGTFVKVDVTDLQKSLASITSRRSEAAKNAVVLCSRFTKEVLKSKEFLNRKELLFSYFEIPACTDAAEFLVEENVQRPIELALEFPLRGQEGIDGLIGEEKAEAAIVKTETSWLQYSDWFSNLLGSLVFISEANAQEKRRYHLQLADWNSRQLTSDQIVEFAPKKSRSSVTGSLGLHKGYAIPEKFNVNTQNLGQELTSLRRLLKGGSL